MHPSSTRPGTAEEPAGLAHFGRYDRTPADVAYGDSLEATERAAREHWWGIDKNTLATADLIPFVNHSPELNTFLGGQFTFRYTGPEWGEGDKILDPKRAVTAGHREWSDLALVTDITGLRRLHTLDTHVEHGVAHGVLQLPEAKGQPKMTLREVYATAGESMDRHGHPRLIMTLTEYGDWLARVKAAKAEGFLTILLVRGARPANFDAEVRPHVDRLWGTAWGPL